ncbi:MAG: histidine kinase [Bacteroidota bacterium]|nr:histidine kinase [Bacteroidota bacterium]
MYVYSQTFIYPFDFEKFHHHQNFEKNAGPLSGPPQGFDKNFFNPDIMPIPSPPFSDKEPPRLLNGKYMYPENNRDCSVPIVMYIERAYFSIKPGTIPFSLIILMLGIGIKMIIEWYKNERQRAVLEKEKLNTELAFLKSQINPHFIFNVLNNICSLARKKSDDTENAIIKLSQLLRYNLYDFRDEKVSLEREIRYLNDYIDIQKMRLGDNVQIVFDVKGKTENVMIEPLILIPFVENAFKHGVNTTDNCKIEISIDCDSKMLHFIVKNLKLEKKKTSDNNKGIGLKNVTRRLSILYPEKYTLSIIDQSNIYIVDLKINVND